MLTTAETCGANNCSNELAKVGILGVGPPGITIMIVMGADSERGLSSKMFLVVDPVVSKENISEISEAGGTLVESSVPGSVDEEVAVTSMFAAAGGAMVIGAIVGKLTS